MYIFSSKFIYNEYIERYFLSHVVSKILPVPPPLEVCTLCMLMSPFIPFLHSHSRGGHSIVKLNITCVKKINLLFLSCITEMGQKSTKFFPQVDIHNIYYIVKNGNQIWWLWTKTTFLTRMTHNWNKTTTTKNEADSKFQNNIRKIVSMVVYM